MARKKDFTWEWKRPSSHRAMPLVDWWAEQAVMYGVARIGQRAVRRKDSDTATRMLALARAGASAEERARIIAEFRTGA